MKLKILWGIIGIIIVGWIYYIYISPLIFKPIELEVPNVEGLSENDARHTLHKLDINFNIHYVDGKTNQVKYTLPKHGTKIYSTFTVDVYIEKSLPSYYQSFVGLMYDSNVDLIIDYCNEHNITYKVVYEINNAYTSGQIIKQSKDKETLVEEYDELIIYVAKGDDYIVMPNLVGMNVDECMRLLTEYQLSFNIIYYSTPIDEDIVISQSIIEGTIIRKGNEYSFDIYVSKGMPTDLSSVDINYFINVLNEIKYNYDIIYVDSIVDNKLIMIKDDVLYISK